MTLDESQTSGLDDPILLEEIAAASVGKPAWIGAYRPETSQPGYKGQCAWAATHYDFYLTFVRDFMERRGSILDIGCGNGQNTAMLARYAQEASGQDADPACVKFAEEHNRGTGADFWLGSFPEPVTGWNASAFDYIFCIETIEHVPYEKQKAFLNAALAMLAPEGRLFITTPNETSAGGEHHGIWTPDVAAKMLRYLEPHMVRQGWFSNKNPGAGMLVYPASHFAMVLKP